MQVKYVEHMGSDLSVVNAARISFDNKSANLTERDKKLIKYLADNDHMSPFEHCILTVEIECPIYISKQIMRHRTFSYNEVSRRYTSEDIKIFVPEKWRKQSKDNRQASEGEFKESDNEKIAEVYRDAVDYMLDTYNYLLELGVSREMARGVLPQNTLTRFIQTGNLRNWCHFIKLRDDHAAQHEIQVISQEVKKIISEKFPVASAALFMR